MTAGADVSVKHGLLSLRGISRGEVTLKVVAAVVDAGHVHGVQDGEASTTERRHEVVAVPRGRKVNFNPFRVSSSGMQQLLAPAFFFSFSFFLFFFLPDSGTKRTVTIFKRP